MDTQTISTKEKMFCMNCGSGLPIDVKFCAGCGEPAPILVVNGANAGKSQPDGLDSEGEAVSDTGKVPMSLGVAWGIYLGALGVFALLISLGWYSPLFMLYLITGFIMTKVVMGSLIEWHPVHNTVSNVFGAKVGMFFLWPLRMGILLIQLSINKAL